MPEDKFDRQEVEKLWSGEFDNPYDGDELEPITDALGQDAFQVLLAVSYARYIHNSTRNLIGYLYGGSPLVGQRKPLDVSFDELEAT